MKVLKMILLGILLVSFLLGVFMWYMSRPISQDKALNAIQTHVDKVVNNNSTVTQGLVFVRKKGESHIFTSGQVKGNSVQADQPFHVASVGKTFTALVLGQLVDEGKINFNAKVTDYLEPEVLDDLFVYDGVDYREQVTIKMLLGHTSGLADYFEDPAQGSEDLQTLILSEKEKMWSPIELIQFTQKYQKAVGQPGAQYHYSDTGYILLGLIIEEVSNDQYGQVLNHRIFEPLGMDNSYLMFYDHSNVNNRNEIADVWLGGSNIKSYKSLSIDWSGGGIISTLEDLDKFIVAMYEGDLLSQSTLDEMNTYNYSFEKGIYYGLGLMELRFKEIFPLLGHLSNMQGHMGVLGTTMFYDPVSKTSYISSFGSTDYTVGSIKSMIEILSTLERVK